MDKAEIEVVPEAANLCASVMVTKSFGSMFQSMMASSKVELPYEVADEKMGRN